MIQSLQTISSHNTTLRTSKVALSEKLLTSILYLNNSIFSLDNFEEISSGGSKRQKLNDSQQSSKVRPGSIKNSDEPLRFKNVILIEGEVYWEI